MNVEYLTNKHQVLDMQSYEHVRVWSHFLLGSVNVQKPFPKS